METSVIPERLRKFEIPGRITFAAGNGGLPKINVATGRSAAEIYLHGAHVAGFPEKWRTAAVVPEPPQPVCHRARRFAAACPSVFPGSGRGKATCSRLRADCGMGLGGNVITPDGGATLRFRLPPTAAGAAWPPFDTEFIVTATDHLTMELTTTNRSPDRNIWNSRIACTLILPWVTLRRFRSRVSKARRFWITRRAPVARARWNTMRPCASRRKRTGFILTRRARWKFATTISAEPFGWKNSIPVPPSSGIRGPPRKCRTTSTRRSTGAWFAWNRGT